ncbi:protein kinase [Actinosynnema sp. NPDC050801]|uniref:serine/threonine-protein kinase n=1 Tax=unclassified Actinosynnema TaxID=2637065 RepID=UPI0033EBF822
MQRPSKIGRYPVQSLLGTGAFAVVWLAEDERLHDRVAIKVLAENWAERLDVRQRFEQEARVLRRTRSHRVVEVFDVDELPDGRPYFVMTYADGGSLADLLADGPLPVEQALRHGVELALGVEDLHLAGVLHRDIKPSNVLFRTDPGGARLLIADLGLSRELALGSRFTLPVGTAGYMAPEQQDPDHVLDERADVHGAAATIYHALTGRPPRSPAAAPSTLRPGLPAATDAVLLRALSTDPADRWPTAAAFAAALDGLLTTSAARRRFPAVLVAALAAVLVLAAFTAFEWLPPPHSPGAQRTVIAQRTTTGSVPTAASAEMSSSLTSPSPYLDAPVIPPVGQDIPTDTTTPDHSPPTSTATAPVPPQPTSKPKSGGPNCLHDQGNGSYVATEHVTDRSGTTAIGVIQTCKDGAQRYWAYLVLYDPLPEGSWANAHLERWTDGTYNALFTCKATAHGASGHIRPGGVRCWSPKVDGVDTIKTFVTSAKVCRGAVDDTSDCFGVGQNPRRR